MREKSDAVVFLGCGYPMGGVLFLAHMGIALYKISCNYNFDFYFASISNEEQSGYWELAHSRIDRRFIIKADSFELLAENVVLLAERYARVIVHTCGGWGQTRYFIRARSRMNKMFATRLVFIGTTHSYRIESLLRIPMSMFQYVLYRLYYKKIVFQCQYAADLFVGGNNLIKRGVGVVVPLGCEPFDEISLSIPEGIATKDDLVKTLQDKSLFKFVYLAAFRPGKMHAWLIQAMMPILKMHTDVRVLFCGTGDSAMIDSLRLSIERRKLQEQLLLTGQIERKEVPWLLAHCNCAIIPSKAETFGHNFLEPMFAGLPVIGTRVGIGRDIIRDGETGYGFDFGDVGGMQFAMEVLLKDRAAAQRMGERAKRLVTKEFTHDKIATRMMNLYEEVFEEFKA